MAPEETAHIPVFDAESEDTFIIAREVKFKGRALSWETLSSIFYFQDILLCLSAYESFFERALVRETVAREDYIPLMDDRLFWVMGPWGVIICCFMTPVELFLVGALLNVACS